MTACLHILWQAGPAYAQEEWETGSLLFAGGEGALTTGTVALMLGDKVGSYDLMGTAATVEVEFFRPAEARRYPVQPTAMEARRNLLGGEEAEIEAVALDPETIVFDFRLEAGLDALAMVDVQLDARDTTTTMTPLGSGLTVDRAGDPLHFQVISGSQIMRIRTMDGFRIVTPLQPGNGARLTISGKELSREEILGLGTPVNIPERAADEAQRNPLAPPGRYESGDRM